MIFTNRNHLKRGCKDSFCYMILSQWLKVPNISNIFARCHLMWRERNMYVLWGSRRQTGKLNNSYLPQEESASRKKTRTIWRPTDKGDSPVEVAAVRAISRPSKRYTATPLGLTLSPNTYRKFHLWIHFPHVANAAVVNSKAKDTCSNRN